jgi:uncharacterized SAM-binding protein YcdF (DUF218 family)
MTYTQPLLFIFLGLSLAGLVLSRRGRRSGLTWLGLGGLVLVSWPPFDWLLSRPLEAGYPVRRFEPPADLQAIVVFGSAVDAPDATRPYASPDDMTSERCRHAAWIHSLRANLPVLVSGGAGRPRQPAVATTMKELLERSGVPADLIWTEARSRNTYENALHSAEILRQNGIAKVALVVEARSMYRAAACLRRQGIEVTPAPSSFRELQSFSEEWMPSWRAVAENEATLHEVLGAAWYRIRGRL